ncbi:MAG: POTRA domain-containing protein [Calditrichaceae bacterium]
MVLKDVEFIGDFELNHGKMISAMQLVRGRPFNRVDFKSSAGKLLDYMHSQGFIYAYIDSITTEINSDHNNVRMLIYGRSGDRAYFGDISVEADSLDADRYRQLLDIRKGDIYSESHLENNIQYLLNYAADSGYPFADIKTENIVVNNENGRNYAQIDLKIEEGHKIFISGINITGNTYTSDNVILRELDLIPGALYSKKLVDEIPESLMRLQIFKNIKLNGINLVSADSVQVNIEVEEGNSIMMDGVVGYTPDVSGNGSGGNFNGLFNLSLKNIFGTARKFDVHWEKPDTYSEQFNLRYTEPWVLDYPLDASVGLDRTVRDSSFVKWNTFLNMRFRVLSNLSVIAGISRNLAFPDSASSRDNRLLRNEVINLELGLEYDTRDYPQNPRAGLFYSNSYAYGFKNNYGPSYLFVEDSIRKKEELQIIQLKFGWYYNLWSNQVFSLELNGKQIKGDDLQLTDVFWFGGSQTLRGYRENQFWGKVIAWANIEYRFILNRNSRFWAKATALVKEKFILVL